VANLHPNRLMRPDHGIALAALLLVSTAWGDPSADAVWPIDRTDRVAGLTPIVLGSPTARTDDRGRALYFNGATDGLFVPVNPIAGWPEFTIEALIDPDPTGPAEQRFLHIQDEAGSRSLLEIRMTPGGWALDTFLFSEKTKSSRPLLDMTKLHPANRWTWVALVYAHGHMAHYIDGVKELEGDVDIPPMTAGQISLGVRQNKVYWFKGGIREVRFHPTALKPVELQRPLGRDR
jgi:hypothetical protein